MPDESQQFRVLYRDFLSRIVDLELLAAGGDARALIARFGSMLAALSFIMTYLIVPRYATSSYSHARLARLAWNTVFPDRRDGLILGLIPVRHRTMMLARMAAIATVVGAAIGAINVVTGISFPFALSSGVIEGLRSVVTWWMVMAAAGAFTFCAGLALQGIAAQLLPWRLFLRVSGLLQLVALSAMLAGLFLTPPFDSLNPPVFIPSFWFVGLLHELRGDSSPPFDTLAARALGGLAIVVLPAAVLYVVSWSRNVRRMVESPDILPAKHARFTAWFAKKCSPAPFGRAILLFTARTIARSRQHRLMLAIYGGFAFAVSLAFSGSLLNASRESWSRPNGPFLLAGFLLLACAVVGTRVIFALPIALPANWIFRITAVHRPADYFAAVRKSLYTIAALPVWIATAIGYLAIWPGRPAFEHILVLALIGVIVVERSLYQFRKIPFTCSWLPGSAHGKMKAGISACLFILLASFAAATEVWSMEKFARIVVVLGTLSAFALRARLRTAEFAGETQNRLQFEDLPPAEIFALDLWQDGSWSGDEAYVDAIDPNMGRGLPARIRPFAVGVALLLTVGLLYEQVGQWRDRTQFPQVGKSVDIGGRSLNLYCSGTGSPAVVFDSGANAPGYSWILVQPEVAKMTRACWYDRAGYGWSDPAPAARSSADIADDLHRLLRAAGVQPPYVLTGHSFGGFNVRVFASRYPTETAGIVLVDSADEFEGPLPDALQTAGPADIPRWLWPATAKIVEVFIHLGLGRLIDDGPPPSQWHLSSHDSAVIHSLQLQAKFFEVTMRESLDHDQSVGQVQAVRSFGNIPLVVLTAGATPPQPGLDEVTAAARTRNRIYGTQARLATLSTRGRQIILPHTGHGIPAEAPEAMVGAVREVLNEIGVSAP